MSHFFNRPGRSPSSSEDESEDFEKISNSSIKSVSTTKSSKSASTNKTSTSSRDFSNIPTPDAIRSLSSSMSSLAMTDVSELSELRDAASTPTPFKDQSTTIERLERLTTELTAKITNMEKENEEVKNDNQYQKNVLRKNSDEIWNLKLEITSAKIYFDSSMKVMETTKGVKFIEDDGARFEQLVAEIKKQKAEISTLKDSLQKEIERNYRICQEGISEVTIKAELEEMKPLMTKISKDKEISDKMKEIEDLQYELFDAKREIKERDDRISELETENDALKKLKPGKAKKESRRSKLRAEKAKEEDKPNLEKTVELEVRLRELNNEFNKVLDTLDAQDKIREDEAKTHEEEKRIQRNHIEDLYRTISDLKRNRDS